MEPAGYRAEGRLKGFELIDATETDKKGVRKINQRRARIREKTHERNGPEWRKKKPIHLSETDPADTRFAAGA